MFIDKELNSYLKSSHTIEQKSAVFAEWNLNEPENIKLVGNYRYRPSDPESEYSSISPIFDPIDERNDYTGATNADILIDGGFDDEDNPILFTNRNKKIELLYSLEDCLKPYRPRSGINKLLYLSAFAAPAGANQYIDYLNRYVSRRPRYYMSSKFDQFKYWTSYRTEVIDGESKEFGVSENDLAQNYYISDAAPFVIYKNAVPSNRIVIKMQTNVGEEDLGPFRIGFETNIDDPLYGDKNKTVPKKWKVQVLKNDNWIDVISFGKDSLRSDNSQIIKSDGYVELEYGIDLPVQYQDTFVFVDYLKSADSLPESAPLGYTYIVSENENDRGLAYIFDGGNSIPDKPGWSTFIPKYSWSLGNEEITRSFKIVKKINNPEYFVEDSKNIFREVDFIEGIRVVVDQMNVPNSTFDLIEISPRIKVDLSEITTQFNVTRTASDLSNGALPVGSLIASTGNLEIFDNELVFNENNSFDIETKRGSLIASRRTSKIKFNFYDVTKNVNRFDYYVPVKTMYSEGIPSSSDGSTSISIELRDFYFYLESEKAPEMLLTDVSLSYAITVLLDNIGFSNYVFKRLPNEKEFVIPYFFVGATQSVAEVLQDLAISSQTAMFFDEYNNFVVMSKEYILPSDDQRNVDLTLYGNEEEFDIDPGYAKIEENYVTIQTEEKHFLSPGDIVIVSGFDININGEHEIKTTTDYTFSYDSSSPTADAITETGGRVKSKNLPNIVNIASDEKRVYNNGQINYTTRYIQRSIGKIAQAYYNAEGQNFVYKPVLLWEVAPGEIVSSVNELPSQAQGFYLAASPLKTSLTDELPYVDGGRIFNNIIDLGENIYWLTSKYTGYLYANSEIIKYDAIEYAVQGVGIVWISSAQEYLDYFSRLKFNGKMYPTGNVRIYCEPEYETVDDIIKLKNGIVRKNGRGQFGTNVVFHSAGLTQDSYWTNDEYVRGMIQDAKKYLFTLDPIIEYPASLGPGTAGKSKTTTFFSINADDYAKNSTRNGVIKNFLSNKNLTEKDTNYYKTAKTGSIQTSALVFNGPDIPDEINSTDFVSYVYKDLSNAIPRQTSFITETETTEENPNTKYTHFGTRMRVVGKLESATNKTQTPVGSYELFSNNQATSSFPSNEIILNGGSGGIGFGLNKENNNGYFYEIVALTTDQINNYRANAGATSFKVAKDPETIAQDDVVAFYTETQHNFRAGDKIIISGMIDDNNQSNASSTLNGEHVILSVANDRKSFVAQILGATEVGPVPLYRSLGNNETITYRTANKIFRAGQSINISGVTNSLFNIENATIELTVTDSITSDIVSGVRVDEGDGVYARFFTSAPHEFVPGQKIDISSTAPDQFNLKSALVVETTTNSFKVEAFNLTENFTTKGGKAFGLAEKFIVRRAVSGVGSGGTATYIPLTTTSKSGGTASKPDLNFANISNVLFYKVLSGANVSTVVKKQKDALTGFVANQATITTLQPHSFKIGDEVQINIDDVQFDGIYLINAVTEYTITYTTNNIDVIPLTDLEISGTVVATEKSAIPQLLWGGTAEINTDEGLFATESRFSNAEKTSIYDISAEYVDIDDFRRFYLYLNGRQIATVDDTEPLETYNNMALFVRGSSRCMFENVYAVGRNSSNRLIYPSNAPIIEAGFGNLYNQTTSDIVRRYGISDIIKNTYYSGISTEEPPQYNLYFEEFGTIMREVAYFDIKYDRAFPALYAKLAPAANDIKAYNVSGFYAGSYGAEFLIFNNLDKTINLDDTTGNYLRIIGVAFTQNTTRSLRIDEYLDRVSNLSDPAIEDGTILRNPFVYKEISDILRQSRLRYGNVEFTLESPFIQNTGTAEEILDWIIKKTYKPKTVVGVSLFGTTTLQLGDIVNINYRNSDGVYVLGGPEKRYVVYNIEYSKANSEKTMTAYLVEVQ
jgi:hypothetical protein